MAASGSSSVRVRPRGLHGRIVLARQLPAGGRIRKTEELTKTLYFHSYVVSSIDDLDAEFGQLLCEGRHVGDGKPLQPGGLASYH